jgi:hypothetical protein
MTAHKIDADEVVRRVVASNRALELIADEHYPPPWLRFKGRRAFVCWKYHGDHCRQWVTYLGNDFYPTWHNRRGPWGGTTTNAIAQLIRWCQGKPVLAISQWKYWGGDGIMLAGRHGAELVAHLTAAGWPHVSACVVCGKSPMDGVDWFNRDGVSGPCCSWAKCDKRRTP